jgi:hypothetical protein
MISARRTLDVVRWYLREVAGEHAEVPPQGRVERPPR